jgi:hypothetical protein
MLCFVSCGLIPPYYPVKLEASKEVRNLGSALLRRLWTNTPILSGEAEASKEVRNLGSAKKGCCIPSPSGYLLQLFIF